MKPHRALGSLLAFTLALPAAAVTQPPEPSEGEVQSDFRGTRSPALLGEPQEAPPEPEAAREPAAEAEAAPEQPEPQSAREQAPEAEAAPEQPEPPEARPAPGPRAILIPQGEQTVIPARGLTEVAVADPAVADVFLSGDELLVTGLQPGHTSVTVWRGSRVDRHEVVVSAVRTEEALRGDLIAAGLTGLKVVQANGRLVVAGEVHSLEDYFALERVSGLHPEAMLMVGVDPAVFERLAEQVNDALAAAGIEGAEARVVRGTLFLEGTVSDPAERDRAARIVRAVREGYLEGADVSFEAPAEEPAGSRGEPSESPAAAPPAPAASPEAPAAREPADEAELGWDPLDYENGLDTEIEIGPEEELDADPGSGL